MVNFHCLDRRYEAVIIATAMMTTERTDLMTEVFNRLYRLEPEALDSVEYFCSDMSLSYQNGWQASAIVGNPLFAKCSLHIDEAWKLQIKNHQVQNTFLKLRLEGNPDIFFRDLQLYYDQWTDPNFVNANYDESEREGILEGTTYHQNYYGPNGTKAPIHQWARCLTKGAPPSNVYSERMNGFVKTFCKPHHRMDLTFHHLKVLDDRAAEKQAEVNLELRSIHMSQAQTYLKECHPDDAMVNLYNLVQRDDGTFFIHRHNNANEGYTLSLNPRPVCNRERCLVRCKKCNVNICTHVWVCECYDFCWTNVCKHVHMLLAHLNEANENANQVGSNEADENANQVASNEVHENANQVASNESVPALSQSTNEENEDLVNLNLIEVNNANGNSDQNNENNNDQNINQNNDDQNINENNNVVIDDHQSMALNLDHLCMEKKESIQEQLSEFRRKAERLANTEDNLGTLTRMDDMLTAFLTLVQDKQQAPVRKRTHTKQPRTPWPQQKSKQKSKLFLPVAPRNFHRLTAIEVLFHTDIKDPEWPFYLYQQRARITQYISVKDQDLQAVLNQKMLMAEQHWQCITCHKNEKQTVDSGWITCSTCQSLHHRLCVKMQVS